nr:hypothetical protein CFP56_35626 [Quercus suber]
MILPFNVIVLEREEKDDGEVVEPERPLKIRRITKLDGKVVLSLSRSLEVTSPLSTSDSVSFLETSSCTKAPCAKGVAFGLALTESLKVRSPWKLGGMSTRWDPLSPKFLTRSLILDHHVLNLGKGNPTLDGEVRGTSELGTNTLIRFPLLKANDATVVGGAGVEKCPKCLG